MCWRFDEPEDFAAFIRATVAPAQSGGSKPRRAPMRIILFACAALAMAAFAIPADAARSGAKNTKSNAAACASIRSDMHHKGGAYIPAGVTCGKKKERG